MERDRDEWEGGCHCGAVRFRARLTDGLNTAIRCNCSMCRMRGAVVVFAQVDNGITMLSGQEKLGHYQFNTGTAHHYFCSVCGIYTHHQRRLDPNQYAINVACLDGLSPFDFAEVPVMDGVHHPLDEPDRANRWAGVVKFESSSAKVL